MYDILKLYVILTPSDQKSKTHLHGVQDPALLVLHLGRALGPLRQLRGTRLLHCAGQLKNILFLIGAKSRTYCLSKDGKEGAWPKALREHVEEDVVAGVDVVVVLLQD